MATPPPTTTPPMPPKGDVVARPVNPAARYALIGAGVLLLAGIGYLVTHRGGAPPPAASKTDEDVQFAEQTDETVPQDLQKLLNSAADELFSKPFAELTPDVIAQLEQLSKPYPGSTLDAKASVPPQPGPDGETATLIYQTPDSTDQVKGWYEKEIFADYRTGAPNTKGIPGYLIQERVPGVRFQRDIMILAIPDAATGQSHTEIWITIRKGDTNPGGGGKPAGE